jgi:hypothetical protein
MRRRPLCRVHVWEATSLRRLCLPLSVCSPFPLPGRPLPSLAASPLSVSTRRSRSQALSFLREDMRIDMGNKCMFLPQEKVR